MTRITKLVMTGFKSFAKRTEIVFDNTFNVVLGPNGSGKSNVLDAMCFVLGRASSKSLRAERLLNLIYNGGKLKNPAEKCEVSIFFENKDKIFPLPDESIKISRFIRKNGTSLYKINDKKATRQELIDLMSSAKIDPEGYNIILQGDIVRFVEMSGEERRMLIEEVAGISVYEEKKNKAMNELGRVDERLREADILLTERKTHLKELKDDRDQAIKYKDVNDRLKRQKATLVHLQLEKKEKIYEQNVKQSGDEKENIQKTLVVIEAQKKKSADKKAEIQKLNEEIEQKGEKEQVKMHKDIEHSKVDLATKKQRLEICDSEMQKLGARETQLKKDVDEMNEKAEAMQQQKKEMEKTRAIKLKELKRIEDAIKNFRDTHKLEDLAHLEVEIEELDKNIEKHQAEIHLLIEKKQNTMREKDKLEILKQSLDEKIVKVAELQKEHKAEMAAITEKRSNFKRAVLELNRLLSQDSGLAAQIGSYRKDIVKYEETLSKLRARAIGLRERLGVNRAVKRILEERERFKGIHGTVVELARVGKEYAMALDVAAGQRLYSIVVDDDEVASKCIKYLRSERLGTATFLPLNKLKPRKEGEVTDAMLKKKGVLGLAVDLVKYDLKYKNVFSYVFGTTLVVDNIDTARTLGIGSSRMVTLEGDLTELSGAMHGGFMAKKGESLGFQEEDVVKEMNQLEAKLMKAQQQLSDTENVKAKNEEDIVKLRREKAEQEGEILKSEKGLSIDSDDTDLSAKEMKGIGEQLLDVSKILRGVELEVSSGNSSLAQLKIKRQQIRSQIGSLRSPTMLAELNAFEQKRSEMINEATRIELELKNIETQSTQMFVQEKEKIQAILKQIEKERTGFELEKKELTDKIKIIDAELKEMEIKAQDFYKRYKTLFNEREKAIADLQKIEQITIRKEEETRAAEQKNNILSLRLAELSGQVAGLKAEFEQFAGVEIIKEKNEDQIKDAVYRDEKYLSSMGNVNLKALEIYEGVESQYNELLGKKDTLQKEKDDVMLMIGEIEGRKKELFMNTFNTVNEQFKTTFISLSSKGEAFLMIENPENPFEAGVRIMVNLSGTKFLDIRSLSGGEKTMTALAFIFSIQEHSPASFYVFDEVDAALDKKNSLKLAHLIKKYSSKAQYIVISHNDSIIQEASTLYGVSMDEHGTSNVVSLRV